MTTHSHYATSERLLRGERYRRRLAWSVTAAVALHIVLVAVLSPLADDIPLVRHIGYRGELRILPEISVLREAGETESEVKETAGKFTRSTFEIVSIKIVDSVESGESLTQAESDEDLDVGEDLLDRLETSLPQPTSSEMIIEHLVEPLYPTSSIEAGVEGVATWRLYVTRGGIVRRAWLIDSEVDDACELEAYSAVMQWRFAPYLVNGEPTAILVDQRIRFRLTDELRAARERQSRRW